MATYSFLRHTLNTNTTPPLSLNYNAAPLPSTNDHSSIPSTNSQHINATSQQVSQVVSTAAASHPECCNHHNNLKSAQSRLDQRQSIFQPPWEVYIALEMSSTVLVPLSLPLHAMPTLGPHLHLASVPAMLVCFFLSSLSTFTCYFRSSPPFLPYLCSK